MGRLQGVGMGFRVLVSHLPPSVDTRCRDDVLEFNKPSSSRPGKGRAAGGRSKPLAVNEGESSANESFYSVAGGSTVRGRPLPC